MYIYASDRCFAPEVTVSPRNKVVIFIKLLPTSSDDLRRASALLLFDCAQPCTGQAKFESRVHRAY